MTLSESAINEILAALERGNGTDLVRQLAEYGIQGLIDAQIASAAREILDDYSGLDPTLDIPDPATFNDPRHPEGQQ